MGVGVDHGSSRLLPGMNRTPVQNDRSRFSGSLRHYHRAGGGSQQRSWDDWVEGTKGDCQKGRNWGRIIGLTVSILALAGIIAGLVIELR